MNTRTAIALLLLAALPRIAKADIPRTIAFQGVLADAVGKPKPNGSYNVTFKLYDALSGGNLLWTETNKPVTVAGARGLFSTSLGTPTAFGALAFDAPYFVDIQVQGEAAAMTPRLALQAVPYSFSSGAATLTLPFTGSASVAAPGDTVTVNNTGGGSGIRGISNSTDVTVAGIQGQGLVIGGRFAATAPNATGVIGIGVATGGYFEATGDNAHGVYSVSYGSGSNAVVGLSDSGAGVWGQSNTAAGVVAKSSTYYGLYAESQTQSAIWAHGITGYGLYGSSDGEGVGVCGESASFEGVRGISHNVNHGGVVGVNSAGGDAFYGISQGAGGGSGAKGWSDSGPGVYGGSSSQPGVWGNSTTGLGVYGESTGYDGVQGVSHGNGHAGIAGISTANGFGVYGRSDGGGYAGWFDGHVHVGVLEIAGGSDLAEKFNVTEHAEPGTVMAIDVNHPGKLCVATAAYSTTVAGVISGANHLKAGIVLPDAGSVKSGQPLAMSGRVWVKCDASTGAIKPGDLLTTSDNPGHAMKAADRTRAPGATIGKAMTALADGTGLVLALVSLQ